MNGIDQEAASDRSVFWRHPRFPDMGLLHARFRRHRYEPHTHPTYVIALITGGCESVRIGRRRGTAPADAVIVVNPEEVHDGEAGCADGWAYRTFYPPVDLMADVAGELGRAAPPQFPRAVLDDRLLAEALDEAHRSAAEPHGVRAEETMLLALQRLVIGHADDARPARRTIRSGCERRLAVYRDMIEADLTEKLELGRLAGATGVTRFQVIRDFKAVMGLTPSEFIRDRRVRRAGQLIRRGETLADAAIAAGFADQSHFSRAFKTSHGFPPGMLRRAAVGRGIGMPVAAE